jgi:transmembrane sensor
MSGSQELADEAMEWILRLRDLEVADGVVLEWLAWYEADADHRQAFDQMQEFWQISGDLATTDRGMQRIDELLRRPSTLSQRWFAVQTWLAGLWQAGGTGWAGRRLAFAALAATLVGALSVVSYIMRSGSGTDAERRSSLANPASGPLVTSSRLPDGSSVELAPRTTVEVEYSVSERLLNMQGGEAHFTVAPNKARPFIVRVNGLQVRAVGTQFDIREAGARVVVKVIEGKIDISRGVAAGGTKIAHVVAGQQYTLPDAANAVPLTARSSNESLAWREGRLQYVGEPLDSVIDDVNRYVSRPIVIRGDELKALTYTGTIFTQSIDEWLDAIPKEFPVVVITEADRTLITAAR